MAYTMTIDLGGPELATHLAATLTDLEFELLVRERVKLQIERAYGLDDQLDERHTEIAFHYSVADQSMWLVSLGETYSKYSKSEGEVLSVSIDDTLDMQRAKKRNKLSLLLTYSAPVTNDIPF